MKVRILYNVDSTIAVIHPVLKSRRKNETNEQWLARVFDAATPDNIEYEDIDQTELPKSRIDRMFWRKKKSKPFTIDQTEKDKYLAELGVNHGY